MQYQSSVQWKCPSNIALVKYWGKHGRQLPRNASISFTLENAHTTTTVHYNIDQKIHAEPNLEFYFEGQHKPDFEGKIRKFLWSIKDVYPLIQNLSLKIESENSFPHSSGIASSASSMSALAMCLMDIEKQLMGYSEIDFQKASFLARLGSGSASRSVYPYIAVWGSHPKIEKSSDEYAIPYYDGIHEDFLSFHDDILIVSKKEKAVSSRAGHGLMENNPYSQVRFQQANDHLEEIIQCMKTGDLEQFGNIVEKEALTLHALMMASNPPYLLMEPNTIEIINAVQGFRTEHNIPVYFTLDAGPNIHLLYPHKIAEEIKQLVDHLKEYCSDNTVLLDKVGSGPKKLN